MTTPHSKSRAGYAAEMPDNLQSRLRSVMVEDEEILWCDRPVAKHAWTRIANSSMKSRLGRGVLVGVLVCMSAGVVLIGTILAIGAIGAAIEAPSRTTGLIAAILLVPFATGLVLAGLVGMASPWLTIHYAKSKYYVLTSRFAYVLWDKGSEIKVDKFDLAQLWPTRADRVLRSGVGDVVLDQQTIRLVGGDSGTSYMGLDKGFFAVPDVERVAELLEKARVARRRAWELEPDPDIVASRLKLFGHE